MTAPVGFTRHPVTRERVILADFPERQVTDATGTWDERHDGDVVLSRNRVEESVEYAAEVAAKLEEQEAARGGQRAARPAVAPVPQHKAVTIVLGQAEIVLDAEVPAGYEPATLAFVAGAKATYAAEPRSATEYAVAGGRVTFGVAPVAGALVEIHAWQAGG